MYNSKKPFFFLFSFYKNSPTSSVRTYKSTRITGKIQYSSVVVVFKSVHRRSRLAQNTVVRRCFHKKKKKKKQFLLLLIGLEKKKKNMYVIDGQTFREKKTQHADLLSRRRYYNAIYYWNTIKHRRTVKKEKCKMEK